LGRMISTTRGGPATSEKYNGDGVLITSQNPEGWTTRYTQDLAAPLSQVLMTTDDLNASTTMVYGKERVTTISSAGAKTWEIGDALGSVRMRLDAAYTPLKAFQYDAWGQPLASTPDSSPQPFGFTGELHNADTGFVYLRARWYDPKQGTFFGRDPFKGYTEVPYSLHPYQYGYSDPVNITDPTGRYACDGIPFTFDGEYEKYCDFLYEKLKADPAYANMRKSDALGGLLWLTSHEALPGGLIAKHLELRPVSRPPHVATDAAERIEFILWLTRTGGYGGSAFTQFNPDFTSTDTGFASEFQDSRIWPHSGNQVGHFLTAVALGYEPGITDLFIGIGLGPMDCIIGHEMLSDFGTSSFAQCNETTMRELELFVHAMVADSNRDYCLRDKLLRKMLPGVPETVPVPGREGNSLQDMRLSLKGYTLGTQIRNGEIQTIPGIRQWIINNLRPKTVNGPL
jgi:RHS repeat-associated protein